MKKRKLTLIGAGSAMFTQGFIADLLNNTNGNQWHIVLVGTNEKKLSTIAKLAKKMIEYKKNIEVTLSYTTNRQEALKDADYVLVTVGVGGRRAWEQDVFIPRKYGVMQPVGDTIMPGGISRAMRMIPVILDIAKDIKAICPGAVFLNYSNPMTMICKAVTKTVDTQIVGLCAGVPSNLKYLAETANLPIEECSGYWGGVNHCTFIYEFRHRGKDVWPKVKAAIAGQDLTDLIDVTEALKVASLMGEKKKKISEPFSWWFLENHGAYPAPSDRHVTEFYPEYFPEGKYYGKVLGVDAYSFEGSIAIGDEIHQKAMANAESETPLEDEFFEGLSGDHEQLMKIIRSIENDEREIISANVVNNGTLPGISDDAIVEVPCVVGAHGFTPIRQPQFPAVFAAHTNRFLSIVDMTVEAALTGNKNYFKQAILMGGYLQDKDAAEKMAEELLSSQKMFLPQF